VCFEKLEEKTYFLFAIANVCSIPFVWAFYPESNQRTLEEMDLLFASDSPFNWVAERNFARLKAEHAETTAALEAARVDAQHEDLGKAKGETVMQEHR